MISLNKHITSCSIFYLKLFMTTYLSHKEDIDTWDFTCCIHKNLIYCHVWCHRKTSCWRLNKEASRWQSRVPSSHISIKDMNISHVNEQTEPLSWQRGPWDLSSYNPCHWLLTVKLKLPIIILLLLRQYFFFKDKMKYRICMTIK